LLLVICHPPITFFAASLQIPFSIHG